MKFIRIMSVACLGVVDKKKVAWLNPAYFLLDLHTLLNLKHLFDLLSNPTIYS